MADPVEVSPGRWQVRVFINQHPATGQTIRYRADRRFEADGIRRARTQARQIEADVRAELVAAHENPTPTVQQAADQWWQLWSQRNRSPTTRKGYDSILRTHIHQAPFADRRVDEVTVGELDRWYLSLATQPQTIRTEHTVERIVVHRDRIPLPGPSPYLRAVLEPSPLAAAPVLDLSPLELFQLRHVAEAFEDLGKRPTFKVQVRREVVQETEVSTRVNPPVSPATVQRVHAVLSQVFEQCERDGILTRNVASLAHKPEARPKRKTDLPVGTLNLILDAAAKRHPARGRALAFAALTGLRRGEMCGLRHTAVDHALGAVTVAQAVVVAQQRYVGSSAVVRDDGRTKAVLKGPKAHQVVAIALGEQAAEIAAQQTAWQRSHDGCLDDPFLWSVLAPFDEPLGPDTLTKWFRQAAKDVGVRGFTLHDLRHWQGSQVLEVGGTVQDAKERLRHKSLQTTMGYLHADHSKQLVLVNRMPRLELP